MGCDIHVRSEKLVNGKWVDMTDELPNYILENRDYTVFTWLAGVRSRNYDIVPISKPRGLPSDISEKSMEYFSSWGSDIHSCSWLSIAELNMVDYNKIIEVPEININHYVLTQRSLGSLLGGHFLQDLSRLKEAGVNRIVFGFDN